MPMRWIVAGLLAAVCCFAGSPVHAQNLVVATCGTLPQAYVAGTTRPPTVDVTGKLCSSATAGGGAVSSVANADGTLTVTPTTGNVVTSLNPGHANTWSAVQTHNAGDLAVAGATSGTLTINCAATCGTNTVTIPGATDVVAELGQPNAFTGNNSYSGTNLFTGALATTGSNGQASVGASSAGGLLLQGKGTNDITVSNGAGTSVCTVATGATTWTCNAATLTAVGAAFSHNPTNNGTASDTFGNQSAGVSAAYQMTFSNGGGTSGALLMNGSANTSGNGTSSFTINNPNTTQTGGLYLQTGGTNVITITKAQLMAFPALTADTGHTDAAVCEDTTSHALYAGTGSLNACLGTSSARFKNNINDLDVGLNEVLGLKPVSYYLNEGYGDTTKKYYGVVAEQTVSVLPVLTGVDDSGQPSSFDYVGLIPVLVKAIQDQQLQINALKAQLSAR